MHNHCNHVHDAHTQPHVHVKLSDICSTVDAQFFGKDIPTADSDEVKAAKLKLQTEGETPDNLLSLAKVLCLQLRYREAIDCCQKILAKSPTDFSARRLLAIRYMATGQIEKSLKMFLSLEEECPDKLDIGYRVNLCYFYMGDYQKAKDGFLQLFPLCEEKPEMYIAVLYWYLLCIVQLKEDVDEAIKFYYPMDVGHHIGYELSVKLFLGTPIEQCERISKTDNLTRIMYLFGCYHYNLWKNDLPAATEIFKQALICDEYWASFSGLGVWYMYKNNKSNDNINKD